MELTIQYILSQVFVIISYIFLVITYQSNARKEIIIYNFLSIITNGISYIFLHAYTGLSMCFVAILRNAIFLVNEKNNGKNNDIKKKDIIILAILYLISIISTIFTYDGVLSLLSVLATMLYTYSVWQKKTLIYKMLGLPIGILWISYNIYIKSIFGIILETTLIISSIYGYYKENKQGRS